MFKNKKFLNIFLKLNYAVSLQKILKMENKNINSNEHSKA